MTSLVCVVAASLPKKAEMKQSNMNCSFTIRLNSRIGATNERGQDRTVKPHVRQQATVRADALVYQQLYSGHLCGQRSASRSSINSRATVGINRVR